MTNPVRAFLQIVDEWDANGDKAYEKRGIDESPRSWVTFAKAVSLLREIESFLRTDFELATEYEPVLANAWGELVLPRHDWLAHGSGRFADRHRAAWTALARVVDLQEPASPALTAEQAQTLREALEEILDALLLAPKVSGNYKRRIVELIELCLSILDGDDPDWDRLWALSDQVAGATLPAIPLLPEDRRKNIVESVWRVSSVWLSNALAGGAGNLLSATVGPLLGITVG